MLKKPEIIDFHIDDPRWRHIPHVCAKLEAAAKATIMRLPKALQFPCKVTLLLTKDSAIKRLNHDFRGINKPTNVLSFPQHLPVELKKMRTIEEPIHVGDIALSYQYIVAEAERDNKILIYHVVHLLIHGILHLFGYDHDLALKARRMESLEKKVMDELGLPNPYLMPSLSKKRSKRIRRKQ